MIGLILTHVYYPSNLSLNYYIVNGKQISQVIINMMGIKNKSCVRQRKIILGAFIFRIKLCLIIGVYSITADNRHNPDIPDGVEKRITYYDNYLLTICNFILYISSMVNPLKVLFFNLSSL